MVRHRQRSAAFPERLRAARERAGISAEKLALVVGFKGRSSISNLELGKQSATLELVENLARALGVKATWLAYGHDCGA